MVFRGAAGLRLTLVLLGGLLTAGCGGPSATEVTTWGQAVSAAREQSDAVFAATNTLIRERQIDFAAGKPTLKSEYFHPGLPDEDLRAWRGALDALSSYADNVAKLADPATFAGTGESAASLGAAMATRAGSDAFKDHPGLSGSITKIGNAIASAAGRQSAQEIMSGANTGVQDVLSHMGYMLAHPGSGDPPEEQGVIAAVQSNWETRLAGIKQSFLVNGADKRAVAASFAEELRRRDESIGALRLLKSSLEHLARSHGELAAGRPADTSAVIAQLKEYTKLARDILEDLKKKPE